MTRYPTYEKLKRKVEELSHEVSLFKDADEAGAKRSIIPQNICGLSSRRDGGTFDGKHGKNRFIVDQFYKGKKETIMRIICRGWDVDDLEFIRACSQRKASCSTAG